MEEKKLINKRSGRRRNYDYDEKEQEYQIAQAAWENNENDKKAWNTMWELIQLAVFNLLNKDLEHILERQDIEDRSLDITCNIMASIKNKRKENKEWKIKKISSFVYLPCLARFKDTYKQWDKMLDQAFFTTTDDHGNESFIEYEDSTFVNGVYCLHGNEPLYRRDDNE